MSDKIIASGTWDAEEARESGVTFTPVPFISYPPGLDGSPISQSLQDAIEDAIASLPTEDTGSLLVVGTNEGARAVVASKLNDHWTIGGGVWMPFTGPTRFSPEARVFVQSRW